MSQTRLAWWSKKNPNLFSIKNSFVRAAIKIVFFRLWEGPRKGRKWSLDVSDSGFPMKKRDFLSFFLFLSVFLFIFDLFQLTHTTNAKCLRAWTTEQNSNNQELKAQFGWFLDFFVFKFWLFLRTLWTLLKYFRSSLDLILRYSEFW